MKAEKVFKRYDIRGEFPNEIDAEFARKLGKTFADFLQQRQEGRAVVGRDPKDSSAELKQELVKALSSHRIEVVDAGVGPTDHVAFVGSEKDAYSVQVTSSHLGLDTNGFKFLYPEGNGLMNEDLDSIKRDFPGEPDEGHAEVLDVSGEFRERYLDDAENYVRGRAGGIDGKVTAETMEGAASNFLPELLERLGADVEHLDSRVDPPEPSPENLGHVDAERAAATDMDGDRVAFMDASQGGWIDGDRIFAALATELNPGKIVASVDTSPMLEESCDAGVDYTRVGDPFVASRMLEIGAELSGEPNGHFCFAGFAAYNSGTVAAALLCALEPDFSELPDYHTERISQDVGDGEAAIQRLKRNIPEGWEIVSEVDGVKYRTGSGDTVLARPSGTEPKVRVVAHSGTGASAVRSAEQAGKWLQKE